MRSRRDAARDFDVKRRFSVEKVVVGQQTIGDRGQAIRIYEIGRWDAQLVET
jgi:hypothetical protein